MSNIHHRMPVTLSEAACDEWLSHENFDAQRLKELGVSESDNALGAHYVDPRLGTRGSRVLTHRSCPCRNVMGVVKVTCSKQLYGFRALSRLSTSTEAAALEKSMSDIVFAGIK